MTRLGLALAAALTLAALICAPAASAAHPGRTRVEPALRIATFRVGGTNGWRLEITALLSSDRKGQQSVGFFTRGPHHQSVEYNGIKGRATEDGRIAARAPGFGRINVRFEQTSEKPLETIVQQGCVAEGRSATLRGVFRGTIEFRGEGGYTKVARTSARGRIQVSPRELCPPRKPPPGHEEAAGHARGVKYLLAGRDERGGSLTFSALSTSPESGRSFTSFTATYAHKRHGIGVFASTGVFHAEGTYFSVTTSGGTPSEASLTPAGPFSGSAAFRLESPTKASWTGDLTADLPGRGEVALAGPGWWAGVCESDACTQTFPPGVEVGFFTASPLALGRSG